MIKFLLGWWDTPLYLWSIKTLIGFICLMFIISLPIAIISSIIELIKGDDNE